MRKLLAVATIQFRMTLKSKAALAAMFGMPLALIIIFGVLLGSALDGGSDTAPTPSARIYPIAVIDEDQSLASTLLAESLGREVTLKVRPARRSEVAKLIADAKVSAGFAIPRGFATAVAAGQAPTLELIPAPGSNLDMGISPILQRAADQLAGDYSLALRLAGSTDPAQVRAAMTRVADERTRRGAVVAAEPLVRQAAGQQAVSGGTLNHAALGYTVMSVMMSILMMAGVFLNERQHGTWGRLLTTPTNRTSLLAGYMLSFFVTGIFQFSVLVLGTRLLFGIAWGPLLPLFAVGAALVAASAGLGLFLAGLVRTFEQQTAIGVIFVVATSMLGGLFWPLDILSPTMQRIGHLTPQAWAMEGLTEVALRGGSWAGLVLPLTVLLGLAVVFSAIGVRRVRYE
ncbi:MAG TPA: ABC transporter permease [Symbiobacteriaceae bacterium]|nr:ABC transporter permease [Symbiobacteriaceae bacterium]